MSVENKVELLWNGAKSLQNTGQVHKLLKSYYINTCRKLANSNLQIPKEKFATSQMCPHCGSLWSDTEYGLKMIPKQIRCGSKIKRLIENFDRSNGSESNVLKKSSRKRAKWLKKKISNHLEINCYNCQRKSLLKMENSVNKSHAQSPNLKNKRCKETCATTDLGNVSIENRQQKSKKPHNPKKHQEITNLTSAASRSKKVKQVKKSTKMTGFKNKDKLGISSDKVISKTQKQNSLLLLAGLLKKQSKVELKNTAQKRLLSFLK